ncbi:hypothetical protein AB0D91_44920 [Streptomyces canus]|uniref:hypothetical protein n=1 Tax=Streptomyces canus TaxID=58343 RepID=UPI0033E9AAA5
MPVALQHRPEPAEGEAVRCRVRMVTYGLGRPVIHARVPLAYAPCTHDLLEQR